jgi:hypothetical protein
VIFPNWKDYAGLILNQRNPSNDMDNFYLNNFLAFYFLLRCITFEILYIFYRYIGVPLLWLITLFLAIYPYFSTNALGWACGLFALAFVINLMCQVPVDANVNPHNPYLKELFEAFKANFFKPFLNLIPFQQLCFIYFCLPVIVSIQIALLFFFYVWFTITLTQHPSLSILITMLWLFIINLYILIILFFLYVNYFTFLGFL